MRNLTAVIPPWTDAGGFIPAMREQASEPCHCDDTSGEMQSELDPELTQTEYDNTSLMGYIGRGENFEDETYTG